MKTSDPKSPRPKTPGPSKLSPEMAESRSTAAAAPGAARPNEEEIARRAYHRWVQSGGVHGDDQRHWYDAEREMGPGSPARRD